MISLYRIAEYPDHTLISFHGEPNDIDALSKIIHFRPARSRNEKLFETGFYFYLRGRWREKSTHEALKYLKDNYSPPHISLPIFKGTQSLPDSKLPSVWIDIINSEILSYFAKKGYTTELGDSGFNNIYNNRKTAISDNVFGQVGISYKINVKDYLPYLQLDLFNILYDGNNQASYASLSEKYQDNKIFQKIKDFVSRDVSGIYHLFFNFIKNINSACTFKFSETMISAKEAGFSTWLWSHDYPVDISFGNNVSCNHPSVLFESDKYHAYAFPVKKTVYTLLYPDCNDNRHRLSQLLSVSSEILLQIYGNDERYTFIAIPYSENTYDSECLSKYSNIIENNDSHNHAAIIISPPHDRKFHINIQELSNSIRRLKKGNYTANIVNKDVTSAGFNRYILENTLLHCFVVFGGIPWRIKNLPTCNGCKIQDMAFVGIDLNIYKSVPVVGGVIVDEHARPKGYCLHETLASEGESIGQATFFSLLDRLIQCYQRAQNTVPSNVIIHRDGRIGGESESVKKIEKKYNISIDLVEVLKSSNLKLYQSTNKRGTPSQDLCLCDPVKKTSYMINTRVVRETLSDGSSIFPCPEPIRIRHIYGSTDMKTLSAQVYALSLANYNAARRTNRLPVTIVYADSLVNHATLKQGQSVFCKDVQPFDTLYWL